MEILETLLDLLLLAHVRFYACLAAGLGVGFFLDYMGGDTLGSVTMLLGLVGGVVGLIWEWRFEKTQR